MRRNRQRYYDLFSRYYDRFIALHATGEAGRLKAGLAGAAGLKVRDRVLDICTGTGALLPFLNRAAPEGLVVGLDFSRGMLQAARARTRHRAGIGLVRADAAHLPFKAGVFDAVTCAHAFYELKGEDQSRCLRDIGRVLRPQAPFLMMEHDLPDKPIIRALFYIRMFSMGARRAIEILKHEVAFLSGFFGSVSREAAPSGRSKILICRNPRMEGQGGRP